MGIYSSCQLMGCRLTCFGCWTYKWNYKRSRRRWYYGSYWCCLGCNKWCYWSFIRSIWVYSEWIGYSIRSCSWWCDSRRNWWKCWSSWWSRRRSCCWRRRRRSCRRISRGRSWVRGRWGCSWGGRGWICRSITWWIIKLKGRNLKIIQKFKSNGLK